MKSYESFLPKVKSWIDKLLYQYSSQAKRIVDLNFSRLPQYFSKEILETAKVVYVDSPPQIPLSSMGLTQFQDFERMGVWMDFEDAYQSIKPKFIDNYALIYGSGGGDSPNKRE